MLGSESQLNTNGKILLIEEIGEYKYSIDRMLQSLKRAGYFTHVNAVLVGDISKIKPNTTQWGSRIEAAHFRCCFPKMFPLFLIFPQGMKIDNRALNNGEKYENRTFRNELNTDTI